MNYVAFENMKLISVGRITYRVKRTVDKHQLVQILKKKIKK